MKKVLLIEDDTALRENTAELLELQGYEVITASNGRQGIDKARLALPDIIVCDIMMPEMDGYEVLEHLSEMGNTCRIPFVFLSAKTEHRDIRKGMNMGADDYLTKPFEEEELISAIESRIAKSILIQQLKNEDRQGITHTDPLRNINELKNFFDDEGKEYQFEKGANIYKRGTRSYRVFLITRGAVKTYQTDESGKELTTALYKADEFLGFTSLFDNVPYEESAKALEDVTLVGILKSELIEILKNSKNVPLELLLKFTNDVSGFKKQLLHMAYGSVRKKTAQTIIQFAEVMGKNPQEEICIARADLASVAGIATESLIRTLSEFKQLEIIEIEGRNIKILDLESLQSI